MPPTKRNMQEHMENSPCFEKAEYFGMPFSGEKNVKSKHRMRNHWPTSIL